MSTSVANAPTPASQVQDDRMFSLFSVPQPDVHKLSWQLRRGGIAH